MTDAEALRRLKDKRDKLFNRLGKVAIVEALDKAILALSTEPKTEWIPVNKRLPEKGRQVLCCNTHGSIFTSAITHIEEFEDGLKLVYFGEHDGVVAWMPLPGPYGTESENKE